MATMTIPQISRRLARNRDTIARESMRAYLERALLDAEADIVRIGQRYGVTSVRAFDRAVRSGRIREADASLDDFFTMDRLTAMRARIRSLLRSV